MGDRVAGFALWIAAISLVVRSAKLRRKWLWALLSLLSFSFGWSPQPGVMLSIGLAMLRVADVKQQVPRL